MWINVIIVLVVLPLIYGNLINNCIYLFYYSNVNEWMNEWRKERKNEWLNAWMNEGKNEWMNDFGMKYEFFCVIHPTFRCHNK